MLPKSIRLGADCPPGDLLEQRVEILGSEPAKEPAALQGSAPPEPEQVLGLRDRMHKTGRVRGEVACWVEWRVPCSSESMSPNMNS